MQNRWRPSARHLNAARQSKARITLQGIKDLHGSPLCEERCRCPPGVWLIGRIV